MAEEESDWYEFLYFSQRKDNGFVVFANDKNVEDKVILPRHPETNELDKYYLQSMLMGFDSSSDLRSNEILDAFPVLSLTTDTDDKFYKLSIARLQEFALGKIEEDEYIGATIKHLYMKNQIVRENDELPLLDECLQKVNPVMYQRDVSDTVDCEDYELSLIASYVPTSKFRRMKILKGWIEGALHYYDYSIMFFDIRFVGYDDFNENIIDIKTRDLCDNHMWIRTNEGFLLDKADGNFLINNSGLYYGMYFEIGNLNRNWLFTSPNNDNERDGKVMLFRNKDLKSHIQRVLESVFRKDTYRINDVFKWNRYSDGGKFNSHFDTMFVSKSSDECSLYTILIYIDVENEDNFLFLGDEEKVQLQPRRAYIIPHWVEHRVSGTGMREFMKAEIVFKNKHIGITYDQSIADAFDQSCYFMLQSVRHPKLKDFVSRNFNKINEARFYKTQFLPALGNHIFLLKTIYLPLEYYTFNRKLIKINNFSISYITDGNYYYFKTSKGTKITPDEATIMLSMMHLDIQPKKMFSRYVSECACSCPCIDYSYSHPDVDVRETVFYWQQPDTETRIDQNLPCTRFPSNLSDIVSVANISVPDIKENTKTFYFAACQNIYRVDSFYQTRITEITAVGRDGNYNGLNIAFIGRDKNIVKIRQSSFGNGLKIENMWSQKREIDEEFSNETPILLHSVNSLLLEDTSDNVILEDASDSEELDLSSLFD